MKIHGTREGSKASDRAVSSDEYNCESVFELLMIIACVGRVQGDTRCTSPAPRMGSG